MGEVVLQRPSILVSGALVLLGLVDCLVSLACITLTAREACGLYRGHTGNVNEGNNRKERLYRWLGQQKTIFPLGTPRRPPHMRINSVSQFVPLTSSDTSSSASPQKSSVPSRPSQSSKAYLSTSSQLSSGLGSRFTQTTTVPSMLQPSCRQLQNRSLPYHPGYYPIPIYPYPPTAIHQNLYYPHLMMPQYPHYYPPPVPARSRHRKKSTNQRHHRSRSGTKEKRRHHRELTDEQIDRTYTGLDRDLAEGFIRSTMEPAFSVQRSRNYSFDNDSF